MHGDEQFVLPIRLFILRQERILAVKFHECISDFSEIGFYISGYVHMFSALVLNLYTVDLTKANTIPYPNISLKIGINSDNANVGSGVKIGVDIN